MAKFLFSRLRLRGATCVYMGNVKNGLSRAKFDLVIVDEAGRANLPELLIPVSRGKRVVLIGDHYQLPPFIEPAIMENKYDFGLNRAEIEALAARSLFSRLFEQAPESRRAVLDTTYRLPRPVARMVSTLFYNHQLVPAKPEMPARYFTDVVTCMDMNGHNAYFDKKVGASRVNSEEARIVGRILGELNLLISNENGAYSGTPDIGIITPYALQKRRLLETNDSIIHSLSEKGIPVLIDTVDAFQGKESDILIYCATRKGAATEFLNDRFRLNVALSRVKQELLIIGDMHTLAQNENREQHNYFKSILDLIAQGEGTRLGYMNLLHGNLKNLFHEPV